MVLADRSGLTDGEVFVARLLGVAELVQDFGAEKTHFGGRLAGRKVLEK